MVEQMQLERKLAEARAKHERAKQQQELIRKTQVTQLSALLKDALRELQVLAKRPSGAFNEVNLVCERHAGIILDEMLGAKS